MSKLNPRNSFQNTLRKLSTLRRSSKRNSPAATTVIIANYFPPSFDDCSSDCSDIPLYNEEDTAAKPCRQSNLERSLRELFGNEVKYRLKLAELERFMDATSVDGRVSGPLSAMRSTVRRLKALHEELHSELVRARDFPEIFVAFRSRLLIYSSVIVQCHNLSNELSEVREMLCGVDEQRLAKDFSRVESLVLLPVQHIMRYKILLESIRGETEREPKNAKQKQEHPFPFTLHSLKAATETITDLIECFNEYKRDTDLLAAMSPLPVDGLNLSPGDTRLELDYGSLVHDGVHKLRMRSETGYLERRLIIFRCLLLICEQQKRGGRLTATKAIALREFHRVESLERDVITFVAYEKQSLSLDPKRTFQIRERRPEVFEKLMVTFAELFKAKKSREHSSWGQWFHLGSKADPSLQPSCGHCKKLLKGRFSVGLFCPCCDEVYHEKCFYEGKRRVVVQETENNKDVVKYYRDTETISPQVLQQEQQQRSNRVSFLPKDAAEMVELDEGVFVVYRSSQDQLRIKMRRPGKENSQRVKIVEGEDGTFRLLFKRPETFESLEELVVTVTKRFGLESNLADVRY